MKLSRLCKFIEVFYPAGVFQLRGHDVGFTQGHVSNLFDAFINGDVNGLFNALGSLIGGII
ncbi:MAG: hypothetical protein PHV51_09550, partial [Methanosarcinaceae archaeon]|nr:hypothetical protein [Methanosarcinaceae archaeon]